MGFFILHMDRRERTSIFYTRTESGVLNSTTGQEGKGFQILHRDRRGRTSKFYIGTGGEGLLNSTPGQEGKDF